MDPKMFKCRKFECTANDSSLTYISQSLVTSANNFTNKYEKVIKIQDRKLNALLNTCPVALTVSYKRNVKIRLANLSFNNAYLTRTGNENSSPLGFFQYILFYTFSVETPIYVLKNLS